LLGQGDLNGSLSDLPFVDEVLVDDPGEPGLSERTSPQVFDKLEGLLWPDYR
jgi:hypothetical protein